MRSFDHYNTTQNKTKASPPYHRKVFNAITILKSLSFNKGYHKVSMRALYFEYSVIMKSAMNIYLDKCFSHIVMWQTEGHMQACHRAHFWSLAAKFLIVFYMFNYKFFENMTGIPLFTDILKSKNE